MILLDTHIWIWWLNGEGAERLSNEELQLVEAHASDGAIAISSITLWEVYMLNQKKRVAFSIPFDHWLHQATTPEVTRVLDINAQVITALATLPSSVHGDPADMIIAATSKAHGIRLISHDRRLAQNKW